MDYVRQCARTSTRCQGSVAIGSSWVGTVWAIGEGAEGGPLDERTFVLVANSGVAPGTVRITVVYDDGTDEPKDYAMSGESRLTVRILDDFTEAKDATFSVLVESVTTGVSIAVEVARYQSGRGVPRRGRCGAGDSHRSSPRRARPAVYPKQMT
jgi:hypothetical protein